jgi:hypothetical protein
VSKIRDQQIHRSITLCLDDELAFELERGAEQHCERDGFGEQTRNRLRIGMPAKNCVDHRAKLDCPATHIEAVHLERQDAVVSGEVLFARGLDFGFHHQFRLSVVAQGTHDHSGLAGQGWPVPLFNRPYRY